MAFAFKAWCDHYGLSRCQLVSQKGSISIVGKHPTENRDETRILIEIEPGQESQALQTFAKVKVTGWTSGHARVVFKQDMKKWDEGVPVAMILSVMSYVYEHPGQEHVLYRQASWLSTRFNDLMKSHEFGKFGYRPPTIFNRIILAFREEWARCLDVSFHAAIASIKECFYKYQDRISEEQLVRWYRESIAKKVLES